jgi:hypothetical protein
MDRHLPMGRHQCNIEWLLRNINRHTQVRLELMLLEPIQGQRQRKIQSFGKCLLGHVMSEWGWNDDCDLESKEKSGKWELL